MNRRTRTVFRRCSAWMARIGMLAIALALGHPQPTRAEAPDSIDWQKERQFWSFQPPERHSLPQVVDNSWPTQPLDFFILARLEAVKLSPSEPASRRALIRRVTLDLTGLPPTPAEVAVFLDDE